MVETVEACIVGLDAAGAIRFGNSCAGTCLGQPAAELEERPLVALTDLRKTRALERAIACAVAGLGLTIVREIVAQHGGEVTLPARPRGGTIARFWISD